MEVNFDRFSTNYNFQTLRVSAEDTVGEILLERLRGREWDEGLDKVVGTDVLKEEGAHGLEEPEGEEFKVWGHFHSHSEG
jgi:hypothetical protein